MLFVHCLSVKMREYSIPLMFYKQQKRETLSKLRTAKGTTWEALQSVWLGQR